MQIGNDTVLRCNLDLVPKVPLYLLDFSATGTFICLYPKVWVYGKELNVLKDVHARGRGLVLQRCLHTQTIHWCCNFMIKLLIFEQ